MDFRNIRDRGAKKWTSLMLTEHVGLLRDYFANDGWSEQPILDEYEIEEMESKIQYAAESGDSLEFGYWRDGFVSSVVGRVKKIDAITKELYIIEESGGNLRLKFSELVSVK